MLLLSHFAHELRRMVRRCPLPSAVGGGDCYSLGYSVVRDWGYGPRSNDHLDANYRRVRRLDNLGSYVSKRCLRLCMPAIARPCCCTSCCTELTPKCQPSHLEDGHVALGGDRLLGLVIRSRIRAVSRFAQVLASFSVASLASSASAARLVCPVPDCPC